jgi:hypothetical protein
MGSNIQAHFNQVQAQFVINIIHIPSPETPSPAQDVEGFSRAGDHGQPVTITLYPGRQNFGDRRGQAKAGKSERAKRTEKL